MATKKTRAKNKKSENIDLFHVTLKVDTKTYETENENLVTALRELKPENIKTKGLLIVTKGDKKSEINMPLRRMKMLLSQNEVPAIVLSKNVMVCFK